MINESRTETVTKQVDQPVWFHRPVEETRNVTRTGGIVSYCIEHVNGTSEEIILNHSYSNSQIEWFKTGSAMNVLRNR